MMRPTPDAPLVFLHLQKTGGTSLHKLLKKCFPAAEICPERLRKLQSYDHRQLAQYRLFSGHFDRADVEHIPGPRNVICLFREPRARILSHYYHWRSVRTNVIERENLVGPRLAKRMDLLSFLRSEQPIIVRNFDNHQVRMLLGGKSAGPNGEFLIPADEVVARAVEFADSMAAIGILEDYDRSVRQIFRVLNLPPPKHVPHEMDYREMEQHPRREPVVREELTSEIESELDRLTRWDRQLYAHVARCLSASPTGRVEHPTAA